MRAVWVGTAALAIGGLAGCEPEHISVTQWDKGPLGWHETEVGMPYYLPKPYLVLSRNVRYIPTPTVGLTQAPAPNAAASAAGQGAGKGQQTGGGQGGGQQGGQGGGQQSGQGQPGAGGSGQGGSGTSNSNVAPTIIFGTTTPSGQANQNPAQPPNGGNGGNGNGNGNGQQPGGGGPSTQYFGPTAYQTVPAGSIPDGLTPQEFYTYQIIYLPDLSRTYHLHVKGGSGEWQATLNLVNGWMFTGPGPIVMRDSTTGELIQAFGQATADVGQAVGSVASAALGLPAAAATSAAGGGSDQSGKQSPAKQMEMGLMAKLPDGVDLNKPVDIPSKPKSLNDSDLSKFPYIKELLEKAGAAPATQPGMVVQENIPEFAEVRIFEIVGDGGVMREVKFDGASAKFNRTFLPGSIQNGPQTPPASDTGLTALGKTAAKQIAEQLKPELGAIRVAVLLRKGEGETIRPVVEATGTMSGTEQQRTDQVNQVLKRLLGDSLDPNTAPTVRFEP